jgi:hypothetical protein
VLLKPPQDLLPAVDATDELTTLQLQ